MTNISFDKKDADLLGNRWYEIEPEELGRFEIIKESKLREDVTLDGKKLMVIDFDNKLDSLIAFKVWEDCKKTSFVAIGSYEEQWTVEGSSDSQHAFLYCVILPYTHEEYEELTK